MTKKQKAKKGFARLQASPGFTLIELLVVISIITLISSIALAAVSKGRIQARDLKKIKDMQVIRDALELYYQDKGYYPGYTTNQVSVIYSTQNNTWGSLKTLLQPYLREWPNGFPGYIYYYEVRAMGGVPSNSMAAITPGCPSKVVNMKTNSYWLYARLEDQANNIQYRPGGENFWPGTSYAWYYMIFGGAGTGAIYYTNC